MLGCIRSQRLQLYLCGSAGHLIDKCERHIYWMALTGYTHLAGPCGMFSSRISVYFNPCCSQDIFARNRVENKMHPLESISTMRSAEWVHRRSLEILSTDNLGSNLESIPPTFWFIFRFWFLLHLLSPSIKRLMRAALSSCLSPLD